MDLRTDLPDSTAFRVVFGRAAPETIDSGPFKAYFIDSKALLWWAISRVRRRRGVRVFEGTGVPKAEKPRRSEAFFFFHL